MTGKGGGEESMINGDTKEKGEKREREKERESTVTTKKRGNGMRNNEKAQQVCVG